MAKIVRSTDAVGQAFLKMGLYGKSGSGKTLTSLLIAEGLSKINGKPILYIDTEDGTTFYRQKIAERFVHPDAFTFDLLLTRAITDVIDAIESEGHNYSVVVIDSVTHLWEAAQAAYTGQRTSKGGIPIQGWQQVKKPWRRMINGALDGDFHMIICGREGVVLDDSDDGELKVVGARMKAETEAAYEPHVLGRMIPERSKDGELSISLFVEKDRSGILAGKTFHNPNFQTVAPLLRYLSGESQPKLGDTDAAAARDSEAMDAEADRVEAERRSLFNQIENALNAARNPTELRSAWDLVKGKKTKLGDLYESLEATKDARKIKLAEV